jgi:hypothetical protein
MNFDISISPPLLPSHQLVIETLVYFFPLPIICVAGVYYPPVELSTFFFDLQVTAVDADCSDVSDLFHLSLFFFKY